MDVWSNMNVGKVLLKKNTHAEQTSMDLLKLEKKPPTHFHSLPCVVSSRALSPLVSLNHAPYIRQKHRLDRDKWSGGTPNPPKLLRRGTRVRNIIALT